MHAQGDSTNFVRALPQQAQGYLIWNAHSSVDFAKIEIYKRTFLPPDAFEEELVWRSEVWDDHFIRIPQKYWGNGLGVEIHVVKIKGYNRTSSTAVVDEMWGLEEEYGEISEPLYVEGCHWICDGPNYAYKIQQYRNIANSDMGHYNLQPVNDYYIPSLGVGVPYYMYMIPEEFMNYTNDLTDFSSPGYYEDNWEELGLSDPWVPTIAPMLPEFHGMGVSWHTPGDLGDYSTGIFLFNQYTDPNSTGGYTGYDGTGIINPIIYGMKNILDGGV